MKRIPWTPTLPALRKHVDAKSQPQESYAGIESYRSAKSVEGESLLVMPDSLTVRYSVAWSRRNLLGTNSGSWKIP